ncbi:MAG: pectate lyase, partial [Porphyromonadaceae bacterium]|nr:pectate lyase [Porphyromonadaceae bacterium]
MTNWKYLLLGAVLSTPLFTNAQISVQSTGSWFESGYVTFSLMDEAASYNVYCKPTDGEYTQLDAPLVRNYGTYGRADALGLPAVDYQFKIVPVDSSETELTDLAVESPVITPKAHDRSGYAFFDGACPGAYTATGELKSNTVILYLTEMNKDDITMEITTSSKGATTTYTGLQEVLYGYKKGYESRPLLIRVIGQITDPSETEKGDIVIDMGSSTTCPGITIEGVGNDATIDGWGIRLKNCISVEISNLGLMNCDSDEGDDIGLQQNNEHIWIHNCDYFYGEAGSDSDQAKGDGALDCKKSTYITFSYNHFWDNGKCNLLGLSGESDDMYITYHHNWYDHSDSRHPRVRYYSCHVYNNYYDGNAKYGVGATMASSVFVDRNYFRNTNKPMMISMQGTDIYYGEGTFSSENGGMIKAYGNTFAEKSSSFRYVTYQDNSTEFDAYEATTADEEVPAEVVTKQGGTCYNNFDTDASRFYEYTPNDADEVPDVVTGTFGAGRMEHGDFQWTFDNSVDDASYAVNTALKAAINSYQTTLVGLFTEEEGSYSGGSDSGDEGDNSDSQGNSSVPGSEGYTCYFTGGAPSNSFYTFTSCNYSNSKGTATVNGTTYT